MTSEPNRIDTRTAIELLIEESRKRSIIPFLGSGLSYASGFPTIRGVIEYLAKVDFSIHFEVYKHRYPQFSQDRYYRQHPSFFVEDFGWPTIGGLNADLWNWLKPDAHGGRLLREENDADDESTNALKADLFGVAGASPPLKTPLEYRDHLRALVQWSLRRDLSQREPGAYRAAIQEWGEWKQRYYLAMPNVATSDDSNAEPKLLYGDWNEMLDRICEGNSDLIDSLFSSFEKGRSPTLAHRYLAFLVDKLGIPLIFTTNFDSFLERAMEEEGVEHRVFDIHRAAPLPHKYLVDRQMSILKLHGSAYGLRVGESLNYPAESQARESMTSYVPEESLFLVSGFSGSERRMMQILKTLVQSRTLGKSRLKMLWLEGPGNRSRMLQQFADEVGDCVELTRIADITTFLQQLFFTFAGGYQASTVQYSALPGRPTLPTGASSFKRHRTIEDSRKPVQVFAAFSGRSEPPSSWAGLAAAQFAADRMRDGYNVIWIDLEKHHTITGTVCEILQRAKQYDPDAPHFTLSFDITNPEASRSGNPTHLSPSEKNNIKKAASRVHEVLKRGRYVVVLDSVESYGRPQFQHHGIPSFSIKKNANPDVKNDELHFVHRIALLRELISELLLCPLSPDKTPAYRRLEKSSETFHDGYICVSFDRPVYRHGTEPKAAAQLNEMLTDLRGAHLRAQHISVSEQTCDGYAELGIETSHTNPARSLDCNWTLQPSNEQSVLLARSLTRLQSLLKFKKHLNKIQDSREGDEYPVEELSRNECAANAIVGVLSTFRRPRSIACIRAMTERWGVGNARPSSADRVKAIRRAIDKLVMGRVIHTGEPATSPYKLGMFHEGGSVWLFREVHIQCYQAMTDSLSVTRWANEWFWVSKSKNKEVVQKKNVDAQVTLIDGIVAVTLHIEASRVYYADTFIPTRDVEAFYEYLYHRCYAVRTLSLLISLLGDTHLSTCFEEVSFEYATNYARNFDDTLRDAIADIGIFAALNGTTEALIADGKTRDISTAGGLRDILRCLRRHCLQTLNGALHRQERFLRSSATPDTLVGWIDQFNWVVLNEMNGHVFGEDVNEDKAYGDLVATVKVKLNEIKASVIRQMSDRMSNETSFNRGSDPTGCTEVRVCTKPEDEEKERIRQDTKRESIEREARALQENACMLWTGLDLAQRPWELERDSRRAQIENLECSSASKILQSIRTSRDKAIEYEVQHRLSVRDDYLDARHRSCALAYLARSEYMLGHFRQAQHRLDLAAAGLGYSSMHRVSRSLLHEYRGELLVYSADDHYSQLLKSQPEGGVAPLDVAKELRKIERADKEARRALVMLSDAENLTRWRCLAHLGVSQVQLERMLFESEMIFVRRRAISPREYSEQFGRFEQWLLDGLRHLRSCLDLLPYEAMIWGEVLKKENGRTPMRFEYRVENKVWSLWRQFYIAASYFEGLLAAFYRPPVMTGRYEDYQGLPSRILSQISMVTCETRTDRWQRWNESVRFDQAGDIEAGSKDRNRDVREKPQGQIHEDKKNKEASDLPVLPKLSLSYDEISKHAQGSFRKLQTYLMAQDLAPCRRNQVLEEMWNFRRNPSEERTTRITRTQSDITP